ncbi:unnamed protein product [Tilletia laevis]|nr:hypothetical protein A4X03_0g8511 [Tilletia caries]CAD6931426.1 unnamed protein product [Tilletia laevis]
MPTLSSVAPSPSPTPLDTLLNKMDDTISSLHRLLQRMEGRMDTVEDAVTSLEARMARVVADCSLPTLNSVPKPSAATSSPTITRSPPSHMRLRALSNKPQLPAPAPKQDPTSVWESAAPSTTATGRIVTIQLPVTTSAASISLLATTRSSPPPMAQQASSTLSRSPLPPAAAARPAFPAAALAFRPPSVPALRNLPPTATDALRCPSGWVDGLVPASDAGYDNEHRHRRAYLRPHLAPPTPPPLLAPPTALAATATASADEAGPAQLRAASGSDGDDCSRSAVPLPSPAAAAPAHSSANPRTAAFSLARAPVFPRRRAAASISHAIRNRPPVKITQHPDAHGYSFSLSYHGLVSTLSDGVKHPWIGWPGTSASRSAKNHITRRLEEDYGMVRPSHAHHRRGYIHCWVSRFHRTRPESTSVSTSVIWY